MAGKKKTAAPADAELAKEDVKKDEAPDAPKPIRMLAPHGFIDGEGSHKYWNLGQLVEDSDEIALLIERGARWEH